MNATAPDLGNSLQRGGDGCGVRGGLLDARSADAWVLPTSDGCTLPLSTLVSPMFNKPSTMSFLPIIRPACALGSCETIPSGWVLPHLLGSSAQASQLFFGEGVTGMPNRGAVNGVLLDEVCPSWISNNVVLPRELDGGFSGNIRILEVADNHGIQEAAMLLEMRLPSLAGTTVPVGILGGLPEVLEAGDTMGLDVQVDHGLFTARAISNAYLAKEKD